MRVGQGFDVHALVAGRRLVIGGVDIDHDRGLAGHSDGDVLMHAVADAVLGALGEGDLGRHFPSSDESLEGIDSGRILEHAARLAAEAGYRVANLDTTVIAQAPRLSPHQAKMRSNIAALLGSSEDRINVKVTSTDGLGATGRGEGIACMAIVSLERVESA